MGWVESVIHRIEQKLENLYRRMLELEQRTAAALDRARAAGQSGDSGDGGGGGGGSYIGCTLSANLTHGSSLTNQTVWRMDNGSHATITATATVYHDGPSAASDLTSGDQAILQANRDGTYTVVGRYCT